MAEGVLDDRARMWFLASVLLAAGVLALLVFLPFATYALMGLFLAYLARPLYDRLRQGRLEGHDRIAGFVVLVVVFLLVVVPLVYLAIVLLQQAAQLTQGVTAAELRAMMENLLGPLYQVIGRTPSGGGVTDEALPALIAWARGAFASLLPDLLVRLAKLFIGLFIMAFTLYYGLVEGDKLAAYGRSLTPLTKAQDQRLADRVGHTITATFWGQFVVGLAQGIAGGIGFWIFGLPNPVLWGFVMFILAVIPVIGAFIVWAPAGVAMLLVGDTFAGIGILAWGATVISFIDNVLRPYVVGSASGMHPVLVLIGVLGGLVAFGFTGFVLGPLILAVFLAVLDFWREDYMPRFQTSDRRAPEGAGGEPG